MAEAIVAIATGNQVSGVGIIRLSGEGVIEIVSKLFEAQSKKPLSEYPDRQMVYGSIRDANGRLLDKGLAVISHAPYSYTGEDTAELHSHGSPIMMGLLVEALCECGARPAKAGEFTHRAFLNGKLDLVQAEAVIDLIEAETPSSVRCAVDQLEGALSRQVDEIYDGLVDVMAHFFAVLDYPDEDIDEFRKDTIETSLSAAMASLQKLIDSFKRGRQITKGILCAILGKPNVGKSSLLNALAGYQRAIVTDIAGTTRDTVEEKVTLGSVLLRLTDTAGLRDAEDMVEQMGVERSRTVAQKAELAVVVMDASTPLSQEDWEAIKLAQDAPASICVLNKTDLDVLEDVKQAAEQFSYVCHISAKKQEGLQEIENAVNEIFHLGNIQDNSTYLTNERQYLAAKNAFERLEAAKNGLGVQIPPDLLLTDVEQAIAALGELSGKQISDDITARIFERFCVGK